MSWPEVFSRPLDEPYTPRKTEWLTQLAALDDMMEAFKMFRKGERRDNFAAVMVKLGNFVGCEATYVAVHDRFDTLWLEKHGTEEDRRLATLRKVIRVINAAKPESNDPVWQLGHLAARRKITLAVQELMGGSLV